MEQGVQPEELGYEAPLAARQTQPAEPQAQNQSRPTAPSVQAQAQPKHPTNSAPLVAYESVAVRPGFSKNPFFGDEVAQAQSQKNDETQTNIDNALSTYQASENDFPMTLPPPGISTENTTRVDSPTPKQQYWNQSVGVRDFFQRTSHSSSSTELPRQAKLEEPAVESEPIDSPPLHAHSFVSTKPVIAAQIVGPASIDVGQTADFMIAIVNPMNSASQNLEIELDIPKGLKIVLLSQAAEFNERTRTLHWRVDRIRPGQEERLQYRVESLSPGKQLQRLAVRLDEELMERHEILTIAEKNLDADVAELPFE